jgi:pyrimidine operon attenuation protein/uracil phosphoribosyltransferase
VGKNLPTSRSERVNVHVEEIDVRDEVTIGPADPARHPGSLITGSA